MYRASSIVGEVKGQGWAKGQIHLFSYNFASNCHRDFKLGSCFSLWKAAPNVTLTLTLKSSPKVKIFKTYRLMKTSQNMLGNYAKASSTVGEVKGQGQGRAKGQIHLISYNFASNSHRDFKLGSCFSLWKTAPNMTLTLKSSPKVQIFETSIKEN